MTARRWISGAGLVWLLALACGSAIAEDALIADPSSPSTLGCAMKHAQTESACGADAGSALCKGAQSLYQTCMTAGLAADGKGPCGPTYSRMRSECNANPASQGCQLAATAYSGCVAVPPVESSVESPAP